MTAHAKACGLLKPNEQPATRCSNVGCGAGYFFHSLKARSIAVDYPGDRRFAALL